MDQIGQDLVIVGDDVEPETAQVAGGGLLEILKLGALLDAAIPAADQRGECAARVRQHHG